MKTTFSCFWLVAALAGAAIPIPQGASAPEPADGSRRVDPAKVVLRWVPARDAIAHRLFFGETEPPIFREEMSRLQYETGPLSAGTTYYWRVDELTRSRIIVGRLWSFTTAASPSSGAAGTAAPPWSRCMSQPTGWYGSAEALRIGENVLSYQRKSGGWPKNIDMAVPLSESGRARVEGEKGLNDSTIDNDSTTTQIRFLARVYESTGRQSLAAGISTGIRFLLAAQYPNGGWPQYFPLRSDYSRQITYNDDAMVHVMELLRDIAAVKAPFAFVDRATREQATKAVDMGIQVTLAAQVKVSGKLTSWCAQHDARTLEPCRARTYELPSLSGRESVGIIRFLMSIDQPSAGVVRAIEAGVEWVRSSAIRGWRVDRKADLSLPRGFDYVLVADPSAPPIWARFYDIATNRPMFVGRDGIVRQRLADVEYERRTGYTYLGPFAAGLLDNDYPAWRKRTARSAAAWD